MQHFLFLDCPSYLYFLILLVYSVFYVSVVTGVLNHFGSNGSFNMPRHTHYCELLC